MRNIKIGKNDPCPCGSGKKYKKCCYGRNNSPGDDGHPLEDHFLPPHNMIDYGEPVLDKNFYQQNKLHEFSAQRLIYSCLVQPEVEKIANEAARSVINRGRVELERIEKTEDPWELIKIIKDNPDSLNLEKLKEKILAKQQRTLPIILEELKKPQNDVFVELAVKVMHLSGVGLSNEVIDLIANYQRRAYVISILCMLLGFYNNDRSEKVLWNYYHYFKDHYPDQETYQDGPLLGLLEMRIRRQEKLVD